MGNAAFASKRSARSVSRARTTASFALRQTSRHRPPARSTSRLHSSRRTRCHRLESTTTSRPPASRDSSGAHRGTGARPRCEPRTTMRRSRRRTGRSVPRPPRRPRAGRSPVSRVPWSTWSSPIRPTRTSGRPRDPGPHQSCDQDLGRPGGCHPRSGCGMSGCLTATGLARALSLRRCAVPSSPAVPRSCLGSRLCLQFG